jgi:hypothetical protein
MVKEGFRMGLHLSSQNKERLTTINKIIEEYQKAGYKLTLRQLYYQLVSRDIIPNQQKEYAKLSTILVKGRMGGVVDWDAIEDRVRVPYLPYWVHDVPDAVQDAIDQYRLNRQAAQDTYIETWCEKDALSGVLKRVTSHYHVNLMVNRGYSSCSAMYDAYQRMKLQIKYKKKVVCLYLGDFDPSGLDMVRDIKERLEEFGLKYNSPDELEEGAFTIKHIALTKEQIDQYNPPKNPAKITDPRAKWYIQQYGNSSWEVDALNPETLHELIKKNVESLIDLKQFNAKIKQEEMDKKELQVFRDEYERRESDE